MTDVLLCWGSVQKRVIDLLLRPDCTIKAGVIYFDHFVLCCQTANSCIRSADQIRYLSDIVLRFADFINQKVNTGKPTGVAHRLWGGLE